MTIGRPGGSRECSIRSGAPDVAGTCTLGVALAEIAAGRIAFAPRTVILRAYLLAYLPGETYSTMGETASSGAIIHLSLSIARPEAAPMAFDMDGIAVSAGSTCHAGVIHPFKIVMAMGHSKEQMLGVLRVLLGHETTCSDINAFLATLPVAIRVGVALNGVAHVHNERNEKP